MITRLGMDYSSKLAIFSISKASDVENLPTATDNGAEEAADFEPVAPGSYAYLTDGSGEKYVLDGDTNTWKAEE
jgi:hypothetical protein